jgi:hypothetical protein
MVADCHLPSASDDHGIFQGGPAELAAWLASKSQNRGAKQHFVARRRLEPTGTATPSLRFMPVADIATLEPCRPAWFAAS